MRICGRVLSLPLTAAFLLLTPSIASSTSVSLVWQNSAGGPIDSVSGNSVTLVGSGVATLTLDVVIDVDSRGLEAAFLTFDFDTDFGNEVNILAWEEISWAEIDTKGKSL